MGAHQAFEESLRAASETRDEAAAARALSSLGSAALEHGELAKAKKLFEKAVERAAGNGERGLEASLTVNLAAAVQREKGTSEAERIVERAAEMAQDALHYDTAYDTAYEASAAMVEWLLQDQNYENAGEWSAYALLFGSLLRGQMESYVKWIVHVLQQLPDPEDRRRFLDAMQDRCMSIEEENDLGRALTKGVEIIREFMP